MDKKINLDKKTLKKALLYSLIAFIITTIILSVAAIYLRNYYIKNQKESFKKEFSVYGSYLSSELDGKFENLRDLSDFITEKVNDGAEISYSDFENFSKGLFSGIRYIENFSLAPDGIEKFIYPPEKHNESFGSDLINNENKSIRENVLRAIESKDIAIDLPYEKITGNLELTARIAVFENNRFWGITSMSIDLSQMLEDLNISDSNRNFKFALADGDNNLFYGRPDVRDSEPLILDIKLPEGSWKLYAVPAEGWTATIKDLMTVIGIILISLILISSSATFLISSRTLSLSEIVKRRTREITEINKKLQKDYAELKRIQQENMLLTNTLTASLNEIYIFDAETLKFRFVNKGALKNLGYTKEEIVKMTPLDLKPDFNEKNFNELLTPLIQNKKNLLVFQTNHKRKDGTTYPVEVHLQLFRNEDGPVFLAVILDISKRLSSEKELREKTEEIESYFDYSMDLLCIADTDGYFKKLNPEWERALGYKIKELIGSRFLDLVHPDDLNNTLKAIEDLKNNKEIPSFINRYKHKDGHYIWIEWRSKPLGKTIYAAARDISIFKITEEKINKLNEELESKVGERTKQLENSLTEIKSFSYSVSHDLKAPLRAIDGFINIIQQDYGNLFDKEAGRLFSIIKENVKKMTDLINDLLAFSRLGTAELNKDLIDMKELVSSLINEAIPETIKGKTEIEISKMPVVHADYNMIKNVWLNLIINAVKFSSKNERVQIKIGFKKMKNGPVFFISDNGIGFDMKYHQQIFKVFSRLHNESEFEGTGVGLALAEKAITRHGGRLWAKSEPGKGATFYFTLPEKEKIEQLK